MKIYFSPQDKAITNGVLPIIQGAKEYIYLPVFIITDKRVVEELIKAIKPVVEALKREIANIDTTKENIYNDLNQIDALTYEFYNGTTKVYNGADELNKGIHKYNEEGIKVLTNLINTEVAPASARLEKLLELGNDYQTFTMKNNDTDGTTKFIMVIDGQKAKEKTVKTTNTTKEKTNLFTRIKNLF